ncbi:hypothetical protein HYX04_01480 [Candidatus Woesearchaeota archaeon]|nr:hypothetical protein [Candidatus Woesearchaeota archaeon]
METEHECCKDKNTERAGIKNMLLVGVVVAVLLLSVAQSFQIRAIKNQMTGNAVKNSGVIDMSSWTDDEKMQYEHHGIMPARLQGSKQSSQVGSC